jgi:hypothetical protein
VRQVARSHGGAVCFVPGRGCVRLTLPAVESGMPDGVDPDASPHRGDVRAQSIAARPLRPDEEALP